MRKETFIAFTISLCLCSIAFSGSITGTKTRAAEENATVGRIPGTVTLDSITDRYGPVIFDHGEHVDMAERCGDCHHQHGTERTLTCRQCHEIDPKTFHQSADKATFSPCRNCHSAPSHPGKLNVPGLKAAYHRACFSCHREVSNIGTDPKGCTEICHEKRNQRAEQMN